MLPLALLANPAVAPHRSGLSPLLCGILRGILAVSIGCCSGESVLGRLPRDVCLLLLSPAWDIDDDDSGRLSQTRLQEVNSCSIALFQHFTWQAERWAGCENLHAQTLLAEHFLISLAAELVFYSAELGWHWRLPFLTHCEGCATSSHRSTCLQPRRAYGCAAVGTFPEAVGQNVPPPSSRGLGRFSAFSASEIRRC